MAYSNTNKSYQEQASEHLLDVAWHGGYFSAICPFHSDSRPSLMVYPNWYECKTCGAKGNTRSLIQKISSAPPIVITKKYSGLPIWNRWLSKYENWEGIVWEAHQNLLRYKENQIYFSSRGISEYMNTGYFGYLDGWYVFPMYDKNKRLIDLVLRKGENKISSSKYVLRPREDGEGSNLYIPDWDMFESSEELHLTFGIVDAWSFISCGYASLTGTTGLDLNLELFDSIRKPIWIFPDKWEESAGLQLARGLGWRGKVAYINYPDGCKDSNDILKNHGKEKLKELIEEAKNTSMFTSHRREHEYMAG